MATILSVAGGAGDARAIDGAAAALANGGIVVYPTDTFYGLAVDPRNAAAAQALFVAKGRDAGRASPLIAANIQQAERAVELNARARVLAQRFWPGPLSLILPARASIDIAILGGNSTAAIRVPAHDIARAFASAAGFCITATSANLSGEPPARSCNELSLSLLEHIAVVLDSGVLAGGLPSTIVDVTSDVPRLIRAGAIAWERVLESLE